MRRDIAALAERRFDLVVIGGGIYGISIAWDAILRGLSVALLDRGDFVNATSANSFRVVHGGIRYLQHADIERVRQSSGERRTLLRVAPHLVEPLPIVVPTYGHGRRGRAMLGAAIGLYDLLTLDRNRGIRDRSRRIPSGRLLDRQAVLELFPSLGPADPSGGALFHDGQMYNPTRLALAFLRSAIGRGARAANYVEAVGFERDGQQVTGVLVRDCFSGDTFSIRAGVVANAAGPWAEKLLLRSLGSGLSPAGTYSRDLCFIVGRRPAHRFGLAVPGRTRDPDAILDRQARHLFVVPWRDVTLIGVWHAVQNETADELSVTESDIESCIEEINEAHPTLEISVDEVLMWNAGLVLFGRNAPGATHLSYGKRSRIVDHSRTHAVGGLITAIGVRWTTARAAAKDVVDLACRKLGRPVGRSGTDATPVFGGAIEDVPDFLEELRRRPPESLSGVGEEVLRRLGRNYGTEYERIARYAGSEPDGGTRLGESDVLRAEVIHAVREEMAVRLGDVVFRRTDLGTAGDPGDEALVACAEVMASELAWTDTRRHDELADVRRAFTRRASGFIEKVSEGVACE